MKKNLPAIVILVLFFLCSCKKENQQPGVQLRIKNNTGTNLLYSAFAGINYGNIPAGAITPYRSFSSITPYPGATIVISADTLYAGMLFCGTPLLPNLNEGKYTLEIKTDSVLAPNGFNAVYIKE